MTRQTLALLLCGLALPAARGQFDDPKPDDAPSPSASSEIRDTAGMFSRDAVRQNLARLVTIEREHRIPVTIETIDSLRGDPIDKAARRYAERLGPQAKGVFLLMAKEDHKLRALVSKGYTGLNTTTKLQAIQDAFLADFHKGDYDAGLRHGIESLEKALVAIKVDESKAPKGSTSRTIEDFSLPRPRPGEPSGVFVRRSQAKLTLAGAKRLVAAAEAKAGEIGQKMNVAVVDDGGHLLAFSRMDDARPASATTAITKAVSAATYRAPTGPIKGNGTAEAPEVVLNVGLQNASGGKITTLLGGIPVVVDGQVIGAVGVGGGTGEQDAEVAKAAVAQFLADSQPATKPDPIRSDPAKAEPAKADPARPDAPK